MKKLLFAVVAVLCIYTSCENLLLSPPVVPGRGQVNAKNPPENISATHGGKQRITLSWDPAPDAVRYFIYRADSPLNSFSQCAETASTSINLTVLPGSTVYYKVSSVYQDYTESWQSDFVMGSSLARPFISDIKDVTESNATVTWYMENARDDTYKNQLWYTVYCFNGPTELARINLDASNVTENKAEFTGLYANTSYLYQVEAYLWDGDPAAGMPSASEKSAVMNKETTRRFRPGAPVGLRVTRGTSRNSVTISFGLPDKVDIPLGENQYDPHPLYFVISRRQYSEFVNNEYQKICSYFGTNSDKANNVKNNGGIAGTFSAYNPGGTVEWTDSGVSRGVEYEYLVQSYVDTSDTITSDSSTSDERGWAMGEGTLSIGRPVYTFNQGMTLYASAKLPLQFTFDPKGETYRYTVLETIKPIDDGDDFDPKGVFNRESGTLNLDEVQNYNAEMDLTQPSTAGSPGRGDYSYRLRISLIDGTEVDTVAAIGDVQISEMTAPIEMDDFFVQDGYADKFIIRWDNYPNRKYLLFASDDPTDWTAAPIAVFNENPQDVLEAAPERDFEYEMGGQQPEVTKYFAMQPVMVVTQGNTTTEKKGQRVYAAAGSKTMGVPQLSQVTGHSYSTVTATWTEAQKADTYRIKYRYTGESGWKTAATVKKDDLEHDGAGRFRYPFKPEGFNDVARAGKEIQITVDALNEELRQTAGGGEIVLSSKEDVRTHLVGPAELAAQASRAESATRIDVSWNRIPGADGYYVFRRQFNMNGDAEEGAETVVYYIPASTASSIAVTGKNLIVDSSNIKADTGTVKAAASFTASRYTLTDSYMTDGEYSGAYSGYTDTYKNQQNDLARGNPYRYFIVPVINRSGDPESPDSIGFVYGKDSLTNKNTGVVSYTLRENGENISYSGTAVAVLEKTGFVVGFGQNVTATKGTYASTGNVNDRIRIIWSPPPLLAGVAGLNPQYTVYRKVFGDTSWETVTTGINGTEYIDTPPQRGMTYEYVVGISGSQPQNFSRFIELCETLRDGQNRPNYLGYMLEMVKMESVSRNELKVGDDFAEEVRWYSTGIKNPYSTDYNWGIDGYTILLLNRNVNNGRQWITVTDRPMGDLLNQTNQSFIVANDASNVLKVLRDYRHYFKVRSYVLNNLGEKVYCPDPAPEYVVADGRDDDYVKWGARQVSADEFAAITALSIGTGLNWAGDEHEGAQDRNWNGNHNVSISESDIGYNRTINFNNSRPYFVTVSGTLYGGTTATQITPVEYGAHRTLTLGFPTGYKDMLSTLTITGPSDVSMYSGTVTILRMTSSSAAGNAYRVTYNGVSNYAVEPRHYRTCFTFGEWYRAYKLTRNFDWSPGGGIAGTSPDKWWYPLNNGTRAGWD